jgi:hypothetical protein
MMRAWIMVARLPASSGGKTLGSSWRVEVPTCRAPKSSAAKKIPTALLRPRSATAMPMNPIAPTSKSFVATRYFHPRTSTEPAIPANAPEIASARK